MIRAMKPRQEVFDTYWYFAHERLEMMYRRAEGLDVITEDPVLRRYKFCNTYRICDRVTQFLVRDVQYNYEWSAEDQVLRTILFRLFSWPDTWKEIEQQNGAVCVENVEFHALSGLLDKRYERGEKLYTHAFILSGMDAFGVGRKHRNHLRLVNKMIFEDNLADQIARSKSLSDIYDLLMTYPMIGRFMAYQLAIDLNYSPIVNFDESSFTVAGPGALRGIAKCFESIGDLSPEDVIMYMVKSQDEHFKRLGLPFQGLYGRRLQAIDCQGLFCETDKYSRVKFPELASNRVRIKTEYIQSGDRIEYFFPPKWNLHQT